MKKRRISALLLALFLLGSPFCVSSLTLGECEVCKTLSEMGFPRSYLSPLCALSLSHPQWEFIPLKVTELSREEGEDYTFEKVLEEEYGLGGRSLVSAKAVFAPYWGNTASLYDRGFYEASQEAVAYFLDPRNFLNEKDIFQFLLLSGSQGVKAEEIALVLENTAVKEVFFDLEERLLALGEKWNINPLFLAARLRQEQGREGNALLFGTAGEVLGDDSLSGFYNIFNMKASGVGKAVYESGGEYARLQGWDTPEKALEGGVMILAEEYVENHQDTLYLQKWNVDPRSKTKEGESRNFWAQFMQNIGAAKTESDFLCQVLQNQEVGFRFLIPVYENMPSSPCLDPANGVCAVFAAGEALSSAHSYRKVQTVGVPVTNTDEKKIDKKRETGFLEKMVLFSPVAALCAVLLFDKRAKNSRKSSFFGKSS